jgi:transposase
LSYEFPCQSGLTTSKGQEKIRSPLTLNREEVTIGIDISEDAPDVYVLPGRLAQRFANRPKGRTQLIAWAISCQQPGSSSRSPAAITGRWRWLWAELLCRGSRLIRCKRAASPKLAPAKAGASGKRLKTDQVDAAMLARFGVVMEPAIPVAKD